MNKDFYFYPLDLTKANKRIREFSLYNEDQKAEIVYCWHFKGNSYRQIDQEILKLDQEKSHGYQSMNILYYLGLTKNHKKIFANKSITESLQFLSDNSNNTNLLWIYYYLKKFYRSNHLNQHNKDLYFSNILKNQNFYDKEIEFGKSWIKDTLIKTTINDSSIDKKLKSIDPSKNLIKINNTVYFYSNKIAKESLKSLYNYECQICGSTILKTGWKDNLSRIESWKFKSIDVHHIIPLSKGEKDYYKNMICLCPNCHRKFHSVEYKLILSPTNKIVCIDELLNEKKQLKI
jgi:hypothetical protein